MKKFYRLIFYHIYKSLLKNGGHSGSIPIAIGVFSMIQAFNLATLIHLVHITLGFDFGIPQSVFNEKKVLIPVLLIIILLNNVLFSKQMQDSTIESYSKRPIEMRKKGARIALIYGIFSVVTVVSASIIRSNM